MADKKITQLTNITGVNLVDADEFVVVDISADETKAVTLGELKEAFDSGSGFVRITGDTMTGDLGFGDNDKAIFGAGSDLQIYHNGTDSLIADTGSGTLKIYGDTEVAIQDPANGEYMAKFIRDGAVELYHNNALKIATTSTGIDVTGTVTADDILLNTGGKFRSSIDTSSVALSGGTNSNVGANIVAYGSTHSSAANDLIIRRSGTKFALFDGATGDISFYEDTGTTAKFFWDASVEGLGIGNTSFTNKLNVTGAMPSSGTPLVQLSENSGSARDGLYLDYTGTTNSAVYSLKIADATKTHLAVRGDGNVGIGTASPTALIDISKSGTADYSTLRLSNTGASGRKYEIGLGGNAAASDYANKLYFRDSTANANRITLDSSGNVGFGTSSPSATIEAVGSLDVIKLKGTSGNAFARFTDNDASSDFSIGADDGSGAGAGAFVIYDRNATAYRMAIDSSGNVGIGTSSPDTPLHIETSGNTGIKLKSSTAGTGYINFNDGVTAKGQLLYDHNGDYMRFYVNGAERLRIETDGDIQFGTSTNYAWMRPYETTTGNLIISADNGGTGTNGSNILFRTRGANKMIIEHSTGNVGIGTSSPSSQLSLDGNVSTAYDGTGISSATYQQHIVNTNNDANTGAFLALSSNDNGTGTAVIGSIGGSTLKDSQLVFLTRDGSASGDPIAERLRIEAGGNVGIGTNSPHDFGVNCKVLTLNGVKGGSLALTRGTNSATKQWAIRTSDDDALRFEYGSTLASEAMRIDSSGNVGIGTTSPNAITNYTGLTLNNGTYGGFIDIENNGTHTFRIISNTTATYIRTIQADPLVFDTNDTERMRIDSSGNVGIGTSSPSSYDGEADNLVVASSAHTGITIASTGTNQRTNLYFADGTFGSNAYIGGFSYDHSNDNLLTRTGGAERMRIDSSGRLLVGKTSSDYATEGVEIRDNEVLITKAGANPLSVRNNGAGGLISFNSAGSAVGSIKSRNSESLMIGSDFGTDAYICLSNDNVFPVTSTGAVKDGATDLGVSTGRWQNLYLSRTLYVNATSVQRMIETTSFNTTSQYHHAFQNNSGTLVGNILVSTSATSFNTSSDYRLKTDVQPMTGASARVQELNPVNFEWLVDGTRVDGFLAHEAATVVPEAVTGTKDAMSDEEYEVTPAVLDDDGNVVTEAVMGTRSVPDYQSIDQSKLVPLLTAALQEALTEITALKARVTALEG